MRYIILFLTAILFTTTIHAQNPGNVNTEVVFLNENSYYHQGFKVFGSINSEYPTSTSSTSLQLLGASDIYGDRIYGLASFDFNSDGRDDIVSYGTRGGPVNGIYYKNKIWVFEIIGDHSFNNNFTRQIALNKSRFESLSHDEYDLNGLTTGDFDGDGNKDDIAVIARPNIYAQSQHYRYRTLITLFFDEGTDDFIYGDEYEYTETGYSFLGIAAGDFRYNDGIDDIAIIQSEGGSTPNIISKVLIFANGITHGIGYPTHLQNLSYDIRAIDTNESYNTTTNAHKFYRPNTIVGGNFDNDSSDEIALIARSGTSPDGYYRILVLDDFDFNTNPGAGYNLKTTILPPAYRKSLHAIAAGDFDGDQDSDDLILYGSNGYGNNDKLDTNQDGRMFLFSSNNNGYFTYKKNVAYSARQVIAATAGKFSRPEYANIKAGGENYFPLMWYTSVYGDSNPTGISESHNNLNTILNSNIMNGLVLAASSNWVRPDDQNILDYLNIVNQDLKVSLALGVKFGDRYGSDCSENYCAQDSIDDYKDYFSERIIEFRNNPNIWSWYLEDEPSNPIRNSVTNAIVEPASFNEIPAAYNHAKTEDNTKPYMLVDNLYGWTDHGLNLYAGNIDIAMWDDYPYTVTSASNKFSFVAQTGRYVSDLMYTYAIRNNKDTLKPTLGVLQAETESDDTPPVPYYTPTEADYRYMSYTSIIHGARGLAYWAYREANTIRIDRINNVVEQMVSLNIPLIISSTPYRGVSTQFENIYGDSDFYQQLGPYNVLDKDENPNTNQYYHQINWINYAFRKDPIDSNAYYLLTVNDLNLSFNPSGVKDRVEFNLPFTISSVQQFNFNNSSWSNYSSGLYGGTTLKADFTAYEVKLFHINGSTPSYPQSQSKEINSSINEPEPTYSLELNQNYPNPFNPSTTISYQLDKQGLVTINIYNVLGQLVSNLVNDVQNAGQHSVTFNANNLPSGVYFYSLETTSGTINKKMLLLK